MSSYSSLSKSPSILRGEQLEKKGIKPSWISLSVKTWEAHHKTVNKRAELRIRCFWPALDPVRFHYWKVIMQTDNANILMLKIRNVNFWRQDEPMYSVALLEHLRPKRKWCHQPEWFLKHSKEHSQLRKKHSSTPKIAWSMWFIPKVLAL